LKAKKEIKGTGPSGFSLAGEKTGYLDPKFKLKIYF